MRTRRRSRRARTCRKRRCSVGALFTCFTSTKVRILTHTHARTHTPEEQTSSHNLSQETLLCGGGGSADGIVGSDVQPLNDYPLQGYIEAFFFSLVSEKGVEEAEMLRVEALMAELIRTSVLSHHAWLHSLIAKGVFLTSPVGGRQVLHLLALLAQQDKH